MSTTTTTIGPYIYPINITGYSYVLATPPAPPPFDITNAVYRRMAMERFARFMATVARCLMWEADIEWRFQRGQDAADRGEYLPMSWPLHTADKPVDGDDIDEMASRVWSRMVRERVKALPPPGPRVYCQHEEEP